MDAYREASRRQHRVLGHFLAVQAWLRGLECIALEREDLKAFLDLEPFKSERIRWLKEDIAPWFPHTSTICMAHSESSLHSLFLARIPIEDWLPNGTLTTRERIKALPKEAPKTALFFSHRRRAKRVREVDVVRYLAVLDSGLGQPTELSHAPTAP